MRTRLIVSLTLVLLGSHPVFGQTTVYVPDDYATIQGAIDAAVEDSTVLVRPGTYLENLVLKRDRVTLQSTDGPEVTIIDGSQPPVPEMGSVLVIDGADCTVAGFTMTGGTGYKPDGWSLHYGGGIHATAYSDGLTVRGNVIRENHADYGGGMYARYVVRLTFDSNELIRNSAERWGGGIWGYGGAGDFLDSRWEENSAVTGGGAIFYDSYMDFDRCVFSDNWTHHSGRDPNFIFEDMGGGLVGMYQANIEVRRSRFEGNRAGHGAATANLPGGQGPFLSAELLFESCLFVGNQATMEGGVAWVEDAYPFVEFFGCTLADNQAGVQGGAISIRYVSYGWGVIVENSLVCRNTPDQLQGDEFLVRSSLLEGGAPGYGNVDGSPQFLNPTGGDYRLAPGSIGIDRRPEGDPNDPNDPNNPEMPRWVQLDFDLDGNPRVVDGDRDGIAKVDIGCHEYQPQPFDARLGSVNTAEGGVNRADVLLVNGSPGDSERVVTVGLGEALQLDIAAPPSRLCSRYVVYAWVGEPGPTAVSVQERFGFFLGWTAFPTIFSGGSPQPLKLWNTFGHEPILGEPDFVSDKAPTTLFALPSGRPSPITATLQGFIEDDAAPNDFGVATTNAVVLRVE